MAHSCPDCDQICYCNGDIDDCDTEDFGALAACIHFRECSSGEEQEEDLP